MIYDHVSDSWFQRRLRRHCRGEAYVYRFAEDFGAGFQYQTEAEDCLASLGKRLQEFHVELAPEKTRHLAFGRYARAHASRRGEKPKEFTFLGMTFFCGTIQQDAFKVKRKTSRKQLRQALARFTDWIRRYRHLLPTGALLRRAKGRVQGHLNY
jgi:RNA-directed DNA polymerase